MPVGTWWEACVNQCVIQRVNQGRYERMESSGAPDKLESLNSIKQTRLFGTGCRLGDWLRPGISAWGLGELPLWPSEEAEIGPL